jgi:hypothetical protein
VRTPYTPTRVDPPLLANFQGFIHVFFLQWHQLDRAEQAKYYDQARRERALHMQLYPGWSARENYAQQGKKKKRKRDKSQGDSSGA